MSDIIIAIILGIIEGLTEFIPVSSTGHLILVGDLLKFSSANTATFDIAIQLGAILAVVILYKEFFIETFSPKNWMGDNMRNIMIAIFPALVMGFLLHATIKSVLFFPKPVAIALVVGGIIMAVIDRRKVDADTTSIDDISPKQALAVGIAQCAALWPGMSRSASTIIGGILSGLSYEVAAKFSFIIAVPVMICAVGYDLLKTFHLLTVTDLQLIAVGFVVSFFIALMAIVWFLKLLVRFKLMPFAIYRIVLGFIILVQLI